MYELNSHGIPNYNATMNMIADICSTPKYNGSAICFLRKGVTYFGYADFFYIPREYSRPYVELESYCIKHWVFLETCVPVITDLSLLSFARRCEKAKTTNMPNCIHAHPVKYSHKQNRRRMHRLFKQISGTADRFYRKENLVMPFIWQVNDDRPKLFINDPYD
jgi:hypothetical protein